jgi:hypothetical protein
MTSEELEEVALLGPLEERSGAQYRAVEEGAAGVLEFVDQRTLHSN